MNTDWNYGSSGNESGPPGKTVVACVGSSTTAGAGQAFNWIAELERRPQNERFEFRNFSVGGDLTFNALERLTAVIEVRPDVVLINIGANDILGLVFEHLRAMLRRWKNLPQDPSPEWFQENFQGILRRLKTETSARLGVISLPQAGEAPESEDPAQAALNSRYREYNAAVKNMAQAEGASYIPFYERLGEEMARSPGKALTGFNLADYHRDAFRHFALNESGDEIGARNGWKFHVDGIHLNSRAGMILVELAQAFLDR